MVSAATRGAGGSWGVPMLVYRGTIFLQPLLSTRPLGLYSPFTKQLQKHHGAAIMDAKYGTGFSPWNDDGWNHVAAILRKCIWRRRVSVVVLLYVTRLTGKTSVWGARPCTLFQSTRGSMGGVPLHV